jgi:sigma-70-like protein
VPTPHDTPRTHRDAGGPPIETVIRGLPASHREILVETFFRRRTPQQAARRLGIAPSEARALLYEAVQQLAALTGRHGTCRAFLSGLPLGATGTASMRVMVAGTALGPRRASTKARNEARDGVLSGAGTTNA